MKISVILPAYNEQETIKDTIEDFHSNIPHAYIWVINNRSTDLTYNIASETLQRLDCRGGIINEARPGKGNAVRRAFVDIDSDIYILADADMTYPANEALTLIDPIIQNEADMVIGDRRSAGHYDNENKRPFHGFGNFFVCALVNFLFRSNLSDIMSGYRAFNRRFVKSYPILVEGFEIETDMTLHALDKRHRVIELPVRYKDRPQGSFSKLNTFKDGLRVLATIFNILRYYRPLTFFGMAGAFAFSLSFIAGIPVVIDWIQHHYIYHIPLAILATGLSIVGFILLAIGLILDSMVHLDKRMYEKEILKS